jgi:hypothetical protein
MSYYLHFYSISPAQLDMAPASPGAIPRYIEDIGSLVGELQFSAGDVWDFFDVLEDALDVPFSRLTEGPINGVEPPEEPPFFGALPNPAAKLAIERLVDLLSGNGSGKASVPAIAGELEWPEPATREYMKELAVLLGKCSEGENVPVTIYE